ncbi:MAG: zinc-binding dehydrogenase [bacterium]|nr:zinc-binding dehydrogenase [bacterium]
MSLPEVMRAVWLTGHGGLDKLEFRDDVPVPHPGAGEVVIAIAACGMNNTDVNTRTGWYSKDVTAATGEATSASGSDGSWGGGLVFPRIQGADPVGRIAAIGEGVDSRRIGQRVIVDPWLRDPGGDLGKARYLGSEVDGGYAEYVAVPAANAHQIDSGFTDRELASFACSYGTAEHMLHRCDLREGQWVLVTGASGGVGGALVQLAKRRGASVITITNTAKMDAVERLGADVVLDRDAAGIEDSLRDASSGGVQVFADVVGGDGFPALFEAIRSGGHYVTAGAIAGPIVPLDLRTLYLHDITMHGATVLPPAVFANLVGYIERGEIQPIVAGAFPLDQMRAAQDKFVRRQHVGAFVIEV